MKGYVFESEECRVIKNALNNIGIRCDSLEQVRHITSDELAKIKEVTIFGEKLYNLDFLTKLPNLESLTIKSIPYDMISDSVDYVESEYFTGVMNYGALSKLSNLKSLCIENDLNIMQLDLKKLSKLNNLTLINNPNLTILVGADQLHELENVVMHGNNIQYFENVEDYLINTIDTKTNILDSNVFFRLVQSKEDAEVLKNLYLRGLINVQFSEKNGQINHFELDIPLAVELYKDLYKILDDAHLFDENVTDEEKIDFIYDYVVNNIDFAQEELEERQKLYNSEVIKRYKKIPDFYRKHFGSVHCSYNAFHFGRANCEGMVNLMKFMSGICGITSEDVHCEDKMGKTVTLNHAIFRTNYDGVECYFDPAYEVNYGDKKEKKFSQMSYNDASRYLYLSRHEKEVSYISYAWKLERLVGEKRLGEARKLIEWVKFENEYDREPEKVYIQDPESGFQYALIRMPKGDC